LNKRCLQWAAYWRYPQRNKINRAKKSVYFHLKKYPNKIITKNNSNKLDRLNKSMDPAINNLGILKKIREYQIKSEIKRNRLIFGNFMVFIIIKNLI